MKQDKDWIDVMRSSLREAEPAPPDGGWGRLERELGAVAPSRIAVWRIYWPRIAAAAAVLLLFVAGGGMLLRGDRILPNGRHIVENVVESGGVERRVLPPAEASADLTEQVTEAYHQEIVQRAARQAGAEKRLAQQVNEYSQQIPETLAAAKSESVAGELESFEDAAEMTAVGDAPESEEVAESPARNAEESALQQSVSRSQDGPARARYEEQEFIEKPRQNRFSSGIFAGGSLAGGAERGTPARMFADMMVGNGEAVVSQKLAYTDFSYRHHLPLSFGVTLRKEFAHGLSLESGVNYTLLRSDVKAMNNSKDFTQKLHFIGVPLRLNWQFLEYRGFSLYVAAGGMLEKCVEAKFGSNAVEVPGLQWSVIGAVGAQYKLGRVVGLYFEPEVSYYFTETELRTSRTDAPLSAALRLGVRFSF